jgi:dienelactone hydrolase
VASAEWSVRGLLNPVITRSLIYGVNPFDLEQVLALVEKGKILNARFLEETWRGAWEERADNYQRIAETAIRTGSTLTARESYHFAARCMFSAYLINFAGIEDKKAVYHRYASLYEQSIALHEPSVRRVEVALDGKRILPAYLHVPRSDRKTACAVIYSGLGSSKEEMDTLARALVDRGVAALVPDMPGCGESLFDHGIKCGTLELNRAYSALVDFLEDQSAVDPTHIGAVGLCMGGGYAYTAASLDKRYAFCVDLFPLFISDVDPSIVPQWMKNSDWRTYQTGNISDIDFHQTMTPPAGNSPSCPYFLIYSAYDNWVGSDKVTELFDRVNCSDKERLVINEKPVFSTEQVITHTMPVGEQLHWVRSVMADWVARRCR